LKCCGYGSYGTRRRHDTKAPGRVHKQWWIAAGFSISHAAGVVSIWANHQRLDCATAAFQRASSEDQSRQCETPAAAACHRAQACEALGPLWRREIHREQSQLG